MKCLVFLQSQAEQLNKGKNLDNSLVLTVSRSILITSYTIYMNKLNDLDRELKIDMKSDALITLKHMINSPSLDQ
jgi:hypothetical protein